MSTPTQVRDRLRLGQRRASWYLTIGAVVLGLAAAFWLLQRGLVDLDVMAVRQWFVDLGPIAPLAYVAVYALQVILAPIPGLPIGAAAGFVFGLVPAIV